MENRLKFHVTENPKITVAYPRIVSVTSRDEQVRNPGRVWQLCGVVRDLVTSSSNLSIWLQSSQSNRAARDPAVTSIFKKEHGGRGGKRERIGTSPWRFPPLCPDRSTYILRTRTLSSSYNSGKGEGNRYRIDREQRCFLQYAGNHYSNSCHHRFILPGLELYTNVITLNILLYLAYFIPHYVMNWIFF